jgi:hypothetical protein
MKMLKIIIWIIIAIIIVIQFIPASYPEVIAENDNDLMKNNAIPQDISMILKNSCYDCHSNETHYPWYSYVAPVKWLVIRDVRLGRNGLNFSEWERLKSREKISLLSDMAEEVDAGNMPMPIYTLLHRSASLDEDQKKLMADWTEKMMNDIFGE